MYRVEVEGLGLKMEKGGAMEAEEKEEDGDDGGSGGGMEDEWRR